MGAETKSNQQGEPVSGTVPKDKSATFTINARAGFNAAEIVNIAFARRAFGSATPRRLEIVEPDGPSTAGGRLARQTIRLVAVDGSGSPLMCGSLDASQRAVELRSYASVCAQYEERFQHKLDISAEEYTRMAKDLQATLTVFKYTFSVDNAADTRANLSRPPAAARPGLNVVLLGAVALVIAAVVLAMIAR